MHTMEHGARPYRSVLYMPGSNPRALQKARTLAADALILDLEDSVTPVEKAAARDLVADAVAEGGFGPRRVIVRVNGLGTEWGRDDVARVVPNGPDAILLPKVEGRGDIEEAAALVEACGGASDLRLWAMMETPRGILNAAEIAAAHPRLEGFVLGTNDLAMDLGAAQTETRLPLLPSLALCLLAARAEDLVCVDGVYNAFRDEVGLRSACEQGRDLGFDGKSLIHPAQLAIANEVFAPTEDDLASAEAQVAAFEKAEARGDGVAVLDGRIVENLHAAAARRLLARAAAIAEIDAAAR